jgi:hypothetical protein
MQATAANVAPARPRDDDRRGASLGQHLIVLRNCERVVEINAEALVERREAVERRG